MSKGLGSMQRAILAAMPEVVGDPIDTHKLMYKVGMELQDHGRRTVIMLGEYGWCWTNGYCTSFFRAMNSLEKRGLIAWDRGRGYPKLSVERETWHVLLGGDHRNCVGIVSRSNK